MSEITKPYLRRAQVTIGPLEEWRGGGDERLAISLYGDGSMVGFRIKFYVHQHVISTATPTVIQVYNLSQGLRNQLQKPGIQIALLVGWYNTDMTLLFTGSILATVNKRQGPDIVTTIMSNAAFGGLSRTVISQTWASGTSVKNIVQSLAKKIPSCTVDPKNISVSNTKRMGSQGWSFAGPVNEALDKLSRVYGFSWRVENKVFYAIDNGTALKTGIKPVISTKSGWLLRAEPMLAGPMQQRAGVSIHSLLNPLIRPGGLLTLESDLNPSLNRDYVVHNVSHSGDTHGQDWSTHIESWVVVG